MHPRRSHRSLLRRVALTAALAALLATPGAAEAKKAAKPKQPTVTSVSPMNAEVGDSMTIRGRYFKKGKGVNTVVFRRSGGKAVFVKAGVSTPTRLYVVLPEKLLGEMTNQGSAKVATVFQIRVLARRFGKSFTALSKSPKIGPDTPPPPPPAPVAAAADGDCDGDGVLNGKENDDDNDGLTDDVELSLGLDPCLADTDKDGLEDKWEFDCDRDGVLNRDQSDDDSDLLDDALEAKLMTDPCSKDSDADGVEDGYEYSSAIDLNDDEYQQPNTALPYPGKMPYPNPLFAEDANTDFDGDGLSNLEEYKLWVYTYTVDHTATRTLRPLSYSDGLQHSAYAVCVDPNPAGTPCGAGTYHNGRRFPTLKAKDYAKFFGTGNTGTGNPNVCAGSPCDELGFYEWAKQNGYANIVLGWNGGAPTEYSILDTNHSGSVTDFGVTGADGVARPDTEGSEYDTAELYPFDLDGNGLVADDERDEDADGLTNYDETHGRLKPDYWTGCYESEKKYEVAYAGTSHVDADSDGDGVRDGADDQDHDDIPNMMELSRVAASGLDDTENGSSNPTPEPAPGQVTPEPTPDVGITGPGMNECVADGDLPKPPKTWHPLAYGRVNPFNPCLPDTRSRTCERHPDLETAGAPFDGSADWWSLN
jgi:hypothetical protein